MAFLLVGFMVAALGSGPIPLMPGSLEVELALSAAPAHLRDDATVLRLTEKGYVEANEGDNGFTCLVGRSQPKLWRPCATTPRGHAPS